MKILCSKCHKDFNFNKELLKENALGAGIIEIYYNCPKCKVKNIVCVENGKVRKLKRKMSDLNNFIKSNNDNKEVCKKAIVEYYDLTEELKKEMDRINKDSAGKC